ncbi:MAG: hypothetical protein KDD19_06500 [Phaeodactylibacter sp.]|nr:hypothetical protein [Phaeodactylibacter sp.]MCB9048875.1 hypothetical protein [Lewinellaceae bacterium]
MKKLNLQEMLATEGGLKAYPSRSLHWPADDYEIGPVRFNQALTGLSRP